MGYNKKNIENFVKMLTKVYTKMKISYPQEWQAQN